MTAGLAIRMTTPASPLIPAQAAQTHSGETPENTLGALLYADESKNRVSEDEWFALVQAIAGGDQLSLRALYERTHRLVYTLSVRITNNPQTAEELTVDVFHDVWRRAGTYDPADGTVLGWVMNQARSRAIDRVRFEQRKKRIDPSANASCATEESYAELVIDDQSRVVREAMKLLTSSEREAIETAYFAELTYAQAAARLNQPLGTIKTRIRSGLAKLREALDGAGLVR
jgi:RNA polymerase sigma-70 factor, ECF subfamily